MSPAREIAPRQPGSLTFASSAHDTYRMRTAFAPGSRLYLSNGSERIKAPGVCCVLTEPELVAMTLRPATLVVVAPWALLCAWSDDVVQTALERAVEPH